MRSTLGKYQLLTPLSLGGMAELHLACMPGPGGFRKLVALKQILPNIRDNEEFVQMFLDEARLTAALNHPNIGQVFDLGQEDGELYLAMEFIAGVNLAQVLRRMSVSGKPPSAGFACRVVRDSCLALHQAHTFKDPATGEPMPIIHRDISPKNIMVSFDGVVKVIDFGIAKTRDRLVTTQVGLVKGTVPYMSPEQLTDEPLDGRSDLFSLGVVLWELLTGRRMHRGHSEPNTMLRIINQDAPLPSSVADVSPALDAVVRKALCRAPDGRFADGREFARALVAACPDLFDEEQLAAHVAGLFPETQSALRTLLAEAQHEDVNVGALTSQARRLKKADEVVEAPLPPAQTTGPMAARLAREQALPTLRDGEAARPTVVESAALPWRTTELEGPAVSAPPVPARAAATPTRGVSKLWLAGLGGCAVVLAGGLTWMALIGFAASKALSDDAADLGLPAGTTQPSDETLSDAVRAQATDEAMQRGDFSRAWGLAALCAKEGPKCWETRVWLKELQTLQGTHCARGESALQVLGATWTKLRAKDFSAARRVLEPCRHERAVSFRVEALFSRIDKEAQIESFLDRADALVTRASPTSEDLKQARRYVEASRATLIFDDRLQPIEALVDARLGEALERGEHSAIPKPGGRHGEGGEEAPAEESLSVDDVTALMRSGEEAVAQGRFEQAIQDYGLCVTRAPLRFECQYHLARAWDLKWSKSGDPVDRQSALGHYLAFVSAVPPAASLATQARRRIEVLGKSGAQR